MCDHPSLAVRPLPDPFFIVYDARSGSTLLADRLARATDVAIVPESQLLPILLRRGGNRGIATAAALGRVLDAVYRDVKFADWQLPRDAVAAAAAERLPLDAAGLLRILCALYQERFAPTAPLVGFKKGGYARHHEWIKTHFPGARFVALLRDGRAVFASKKEARSSRSAEPFETDPYRAARRWMERMVLLRTIEQRHGDTLAVRYETLIEDPEGTVGGVARFLGLAPGHERITAAGYAVPERYGEIHRNVAGPPLSQRIDAWRSTLTPEEIFAYESVAWSMLESLGYPLVNACEDLTAVAARLKAHLRRLWP